MDKNMTKDLSDFFQGQGISKRDTDWLIGFCEVSQRKLVSLFAKNAKALLAQARQNGTKDNDNPDYFAFSLKCKGFIENPEVVKAEYKLTWSEPHSYSDGFSGEVKEGGKLAVQSDLFSLNRSEFAGDLDDPGNTDAVESPLGEVRGEGGESEPLADEPPPSVRKKRGKSE